MEKLTSTDIDDLQIALAIVLDKPNNASKRFSELWEKLEHFRQSYSDNDVCEWARYTDKQGYSWFETSCSHSIDLEVSPLKNGFIYCPYCAGKINYILEPSIDDDFAETELSNEELEDDAE